MDLVPIAQLDSSLLNPWKPEQKSIRGVVVLVWPYSSLTQNAALLIAEPDFRLRSKKGQVRVQLLGAAAEAVARSKIGSGDEVILRLEGAKWVGATPGISTPGKSVDVELVYKRRIFCEVHRDGQEFTKIIIDDKTPSEPRSRSGSPNTPHEPSHFFATPLIGRVNGLSTPASSAFHKRARVISGELVDSPYDPFASDRRVVGHNWKRQRLSWGTEGRWRVNDQVPSPSKKGAGDDWIRDEDLQSPTKSHDRVDPITPTSPCPEGPNSHSLEELASPPIPPTTTSQIQVARSQYTQEIVDMVSGDTEPNTEDEAESAIVNAFSTPQEYNRTEFAVFRDQPLSQSFVEQQSAQMDWPSISGSIQTGPVTAQNDTNWFFNLPSSNSPEMEEPIEKPEIQEPSSPPRELDINPTIDPALSKSLRILDMPPPQLPSIQTSGFAPPTGPSSILPGSPKTPDIRPQQSATLPLPSPFPGNDLETSYMDASPNNESETSFMAPPRSAVPSPVLPDYMFQVGFGFGSQGFVHDPLSQLRFEQEGNQRLEQVAEGAANFEGFQLQQRMDRVEVEESMSQIPSSVTRNDIPQEGSDAPTFLPSNSMGIDWSMYPPLQDLSDHDNSPEPQLPTQPSPQARQPSKSSAVEVIEISSDHLDSEDEVWAIRAQHFEAKGTLKFEAGDPEPVGEEEEEESDVDSDDEKEEEQEGESDGEEHEDDSVTRVNDDIVEQAIPFYDGAHDTEISMPLSQPVATQPLASQVISPSIISSAPKEVPPRSAPRSETIVIDLLHSNSEEEPESNLKLPPPTQITSDKKSEEFIKSPKEKSKESIPTSETTKLPTSETRIESEGQSLLISETQDRHLAESTESLYQPSQQIRPAVSFAPRVTRRRAAQEAENAAEFEPRSSAPLAAQSQQNSRPSRLLIHDSFEGMIHSDGSVRTAPPSRGSGLSEAIAVDDDLSAIAEEAGSSTPTPHFAAYDGTQDNPSSPPDLDIPSSPITYPELPPLSNYQTVRTHATPSHSTRHSAFESNLPATPEASQFQSQASHPPQQAVAQHSALPPSPQLTQATSNEFFYSARQSAPADSQVEMREIPRAKDEVLVHSSFEIRSDDSTSVLNPWFGLRSGQKFKTAPEDSEAASQTLTSDMHPQQQSKEDPSVIPDSYELPQETLHSQTKQELIQSSPSKDTTAETQETSSFTSQLPKLEFSFSQSQATQAKGLLTTLSYYTPLANLYSQLSIRPTQSLHDTGVDVIAVVCKDATKPLRADKGQRDYYTTLKITDPFYHPRFMTVRVFRGWRAALPKAERGDVILLRSFEVFSSKGSPGIGLRTLGEGAWCVWRYGAGYNRVANSSFGGVDLTQDNRENRGELTTEQREEMRGPPVEVGEEERAHVRGLREWWEGEGRLGIESSGGLAG